MKAIVAIFLAVFLAGCFGTSGNVKPPVPAEAAKLDDVSPRNGENPEYYLGLLEAAGGRETGRHYLGGLIWWHEVELPLDVRPGGKRCGDGRWGLPVSMETGKLAYPGYRKGYRDAGGYYRPRVAAKSGWTCSAGYHSLVHDKRQEEADKALWLVYKACMERHELDGKPRYESRLDCINEREFDAP